MKTEPTIILGIDPGTIVMGYAVIKVENNNVQLMAMDVLKMTSKKDVYERLQLIHNTVWDLIKLHKPVSFAIEAPFFGKNVQSMLKLGRAQGVAIAAAMQGAVSVSEYSPKKVKQSITGNGNADKEQVFKMLQRIVNIDAKPKYFDATDALAVALCHHYQTASVIKKNGKDFRSWEDFIAKNQQRIKK